MDYSKNKIIYGIETTNQFIYGNFSKVLTSGCNFLHKYRMPPSKHLVSPMMLLRDAIMANLTRTFST